MAFAQELWRSIGPIYAAILRHPFVRGLTDGTLPRERFRFYAVQDALYLREFARALSLAAARAPHEAEIVMFNEHAAGAPRELLPGVRPGRGGGARDAAGADEPRVHQLSDRGSVCGADPRDRRGP